MLGDIGLDDLPDRSAVDAGRQPPCSERPARCEVGQRFQQAADAPIPLGRAHEHRHYARVRKHAAQIGLDFFGLGDFVL